MSNFGVGQWGRTQLGMATVTERTGTTSIHNYSRWEEGRSGNKLEPTIHQTSIRELAPHQADTVRVEISCSNYTSS